MTLHEAIEKLLKATGRPMTTHEISERLNANKWYQKKDGSKITGFQIHGRTKNYPQLFIRSGTTVSLVGQEPPKTTVKSKSQYVNSLVVFKTKNQGFYFFHNMNEFIFLELPQFKVAIFYFYNKSFENELDAYNEAMKIITEVYDS